MCPGKPKGAIHSNRSFLAWLVHSYPWEDVTGRVILIWNPLGHISGSIFIPACLALGMSVVMFASTNLDSMLSAVQRHRVQEMVITPSHARQLVQTDYRKLYDISSLQMLKSGGSKIAANLLLAIRERYHFKLHDIYAATEFYGHASLLPNPVLLYEKFEPGNLGVVLPGVELKIVDLKTGEALPANQHGEICLRGRPCFVGYLNNPEATEKTIDKDNWYHTGDIGYYDQKGCLFVSDRIKELIKYKIWSVVPAEIEDFIERHPAVEGVCVVGVPHFTDGYLLRAYVKVSEEQQVSEQELVDYVKGKRPSYFTKVENSN